LVSGTVVLPIDVMIIQNDFTSSASGICRFEMIRSQENETIVHAMKVVTVFTE
jgi:hypothetical protein